MADNENKWDGCYGTKIGYEELDTFIEQAFQADDNNDQNGMERYGTCVWGHTGIGKTSKIKSLRNKPVTWRGQEFDGYDIRSVPIAQFEEMGDLHGMPVRNVLVYHGEDKRWVPSDVVDGWKEQGWKIDPHAGVKTMYAPPDWVPTEPGPSILILDDWNRAGARIIKGIMQLLQEHGLMSWSLPPGCHIVLTANPDDQDYFVTTIDSAMLQRLRHCTLEFNQDAAKEWAVWAEQAGVDSRVISFVLRYPEMAVSGGSSSLTSPRSLSEFGRFINQVGVAENDKDRGRREMQIVASSLLDEGTITSLFTFMDRDFEDILSPEQILRGEKIVADHVNDIMTREEKRTDVLGVICDRLFAYLCREDVSPEDEPVKNFQDFITNIHVPADMRYVFIDRLNRRSEQDGSMLSWIKGNRELKQQVMDVL